MNPFITAILYVLVTHQIDGLLTSIYLHRAMTHQGIKLVPALAFVMRVWLWMFTWQAMRSWVAVHRKHHRFTDVEGDPHSPLLIGLWKLFWTHEKYYTEAANDQKLVEEYCWGIPKTKADVILENGPLGVSFGLVFTMVFFGAFYGWWGLLMGAVAFVAQLYLYLRTAAGINSVGHARGYKNFDDNTATNVPFLGWLGAGEGWHNNHHHDQNSPKLGFLKSEFDPSWVVIWVLIKLKLAAQIKPTINERLEKQKISHPA
ncbi:MAG: stearoyl-CoA desaturase (delta-9 desaturase) [Parcubacteria group bacterium Gr01-1014_19]|nr:MAG: stearoyl-CoA desaturase (delta-9 desaturase) [Parcubacteria group bacterium Gr01-1014_19]